MGAQGSQRFSSAAQSSKPSQRHGRTRVELKCTRRSGRHASVFFPQGFCEEPRQDSGCLWLRSRAVGAAPCWLEGAANCGHSPSGGRGACASPPPDEPPFPSDSPNLGVPMQRNGSHDENLLVGALPVVDYFAFVLENVANSALHRVLGRSGEAGGSKTRRSCFE